MQRGPWCQKLKTVWVHGVGQDGTAEYIGIAADEPQRFSQLSEYKRAPLVEFGIEEELCGLHCQYEGILAPTYKTSYRDGCWFCHNQGIPQLRLLRRNYPLFWEMMLQWDYDSPVSFHTDGRSVYDFERRFWAEDKGLIRPEAPFRWAELDRLYLDLGDTTVSAPSRRQPNHGVVLTSNASVRTDAT